MGRSVALHPSLTPLNCPLWPSQAFVSFRANNGRFIAAEGGGGRHLAANRTAVSTWEKFKIATIDGSNLISGKRVSIQGRGGQFVVAEPGGAVKNNRNDVSDWETFILEMLPRPYTGAQDCGWARVRFKTSHGTFLTAVGGGGGDVAAVATSAGSHETFEMRKQTGALDLQRLDELVPIANNGNSGFRRLTFGDLCSVGFTQDSTAVVLFIDCSRSSLKGLKVEAEVFRGLELKNGWHITWHQVNRGVNFDFEAIEILQSPAHPPIGDIRPFVKFTAECGGGSNCGFSVMTHIEGPRGDPKF
jgi:hypothetical protein